MIHLYKALVSSFSSCLLKRFNKFRYISLSSKYTLHEGNGKTTITILNNNLDYGIMINSIYMNGFLLNNGVKVIGPIIMFSKTMLSWNIASSIDMNEDSFSLVLNLEPKLDVFIIGLDNDYPYNATFLQDIKILFKRHKIMTEILPVHHACATFNFLNSENRYGAAALFPPKIKSNLLLENEIKKIVK